MPDSSHWEVLDALPVYGPPAKGFSATGQGLHQEGMVVRFSPSTVSWVGNFQRGASQFNDVFEHPDGKHLVVVAGGQAYVVDAESQRLVAHFGCYIQGIIRAPMLGLVLLEDGTFFEALGPSGRVWRSRRISWDGMRNVSLEGNMVHGEAYAPWGPIEGSWYPFDLDARTGAVTGGSYNGPPM